MDFAKTVKTGDRVYLSGSAGDLWISQYNVRVASNATVIETPSANAKKILVNIDEIDGDHDVTVRVRRSALRPPFND